MPLIKICGTTTPADALLAQESGSNYLGIIVEHPPSPRRVSLEAAVKIREAVTIPVIAVTVHLPIERLLEIHKQLRPYAIQLHGDEGPEIIQQLRAHDIRVWSVVTGSGESPLARAHQLTEAGAEAVMVDSRAQTDSGTIYGGTGLRGDWTAASALVDSGFRVILAGGLTPENVTDAIREVNPWMVDVISGVEKSKGIKDPAKTHAFVAAANNYMHQHA